MCSRHGGVAEGGKADGRRVSHTKGEGKKNPADMWIVTKQLFIYAIIVVARYQGLGMGKETKLSYI